MTERRVVQLTAYTHQQKSAGEEVSYSERTHVALCDDGSIWEMTEFGPGWQRLPAIPQDG